MTVIPTDIPPALADTRRRERLWLARRAVGALLIGHGAVHLIGTALLWRLGEPGGLLYADMWPAPGTTAGALFGVGWLVVALGFASAGILVLRHRRWVVATALSAVASITLVWPSISMAAAGVVVDLAIVLLLPWGARALGPQHSPLPATGPVRESWNRLLATKVPAETFDASMVIDLPEAARRWLLHSITPGTPLWTAVELTMVGRIKLRSWRPFVARQAISADGYLWAAATSLFGLPVVGYDVHADGSGRMRLRWAGLVPVVSAGGPDVSRSAAGRLAAENVFLPTRFAGATWSDGGAPDRVLATWRVADRDHRVEYRVNDDGSLRSVVPMRWGNPLGSPFGLYPFGVTFRAEREWAGVRVPSDCVASWWWGTDKEEQGTFFAATITDATFS